MSAQVITERKNIPIVAQKMGPHSQSGYCFPNSDTFCCLLIAFVQISQAPLPTSSDFCFCKGFWV